MPINQDYLEKISLSLAAKSIETCLQLSIDPFAVLYQIDPLTSRINLLGFTNVIRNSNNPEWTSSFPISYQFEAIQKFIIKVFHHDGKSSVEELSKHIWIGDVCFTLSNLMCATSLRLIKTFTSNTVGSCHKGGEIFIRGEVLQNTRDNLFVTFSANNLKNKAGFLRTSSPFLKVSRLNEDSSWTPVWQNLPIINNLNPVWVETKIPIVLICNADIDRPLKIEILDCGKAGKHVFMGQLETTVRAMVASKGIPFDIIDTIKKAKKGIHYINSGTFYVSNCYIEENPSFMDFIIGGCEICLEVAIDFTASNGTPNTSASLHYIDCTGNTKNLYQQAIMAVGKVLEAYDSDHKYPVYGFGGKLKGDDGKYGLAQHCFPVYPNSLEVQGIDGILKAYEDALKSVMLSGPTYFHHIIEAVANKAAQRACTQQDQFFNILLILTDGVINDIDATKAAIIEASKLPISIIIVGVGNADFSEMKVLDSDQDLLSYNGLTAIRDIVQFVAFKDFMLKGIASLTEEVLAEIPGQVMDYMKYNKILPNPKLV